MRNRYHGRQGPHPAPARASRPLGILALLAVLLTPPTLTAQNRIITGEIRELFTRECSSCHGDRGEGGLGGSLIDNEWKHGSTDEDIARVIREGIPEAGMVAYGDSLSKEQIRALVVYIRELRHVTGGDALRAPDAAAGDAPRAFESKHHAFRLEEVLSHPDDSFWSIDFLPDGALLLSGYRGNVHVWRDGELTTVQGVPEVWYAGQGGMLDVVAHPDHARNGWVYLSFSESRDGGQTGSTRIVRGRIRDGRWTDQEDIFTTPPEFHTRARFHFGCRIVFQGGYLFFTIGDRGAMGNAQNLASPFGKTHRIHDDGRVPDDNPFADRDDAFPTIWTYGNRNAQGLALHPTTGDLWETEHGPRGGDELNRLVRGANYGWPVITHGINYNGLPITDRTEAPGMLQPALHWTPSIAVCGMDFLTGDQFPKWNGHAFVGGLASRQVHRIETDGDRVVDEEILFKAPGRVRDIRAGPDGLLYLAVNTARGEGGHVHRLVPNDERAENTADAMPAE